MHKLKSFSIFSYMIAGILLLVSCKKDRLKDGESILIGNWKWLYTQRTHGWCSGEAFYEVLTPESTNNDYEVSFVERGKISFFKNAKRQGKYRIQFEYFSKLSESSFVFQMKLNNDTTKIVEGNVYNDTLNIKYPYIEEDPNCENYLNFFVRE